MAEISEVKYGIDGSVSVEYADGVNFKADPLLIDRTTKTLVGLGADNFKSGATTILNKIRNSINSVSPDIQNIRQKVLIAPDAWSAKTYFLGEVITNAGNAYMAMNENSASSSAPTGTGPYLIADGSQSWLYLGSVTVDPGSELVSIAMGTKNASATKQINCVSNSAPNLTKFNFIGGPAQVRSNWNTSVVIPSTKVVSTGNTFNGNYDANISAMEFMTDSDLVCIGTTTNSPNNWYKFKVYVDGQPATKGVLRPSSASGSYGINIVFKDRKVRKIAVYNNQAWPMEYVWIRPGSNVWAPTNPNRWMLMTNGCSLDDNNFYNIPDNAWPAQTAMALGCDNVINIAKQGTGFLNPGTTYVYSDRLTDVVSRNLIPDVYVVGNPVNDISHGSYSQSVFESAVVSHITQARSSFGVNTLIIIIGTMGGSTGPDTATTNSETYLQNAVNTYIAANPKDKMIAFIPISNDSTGPWLEGQGTINGASGTFGNANYYVNLAPHLCPIGNDYISQKIAQSIKNVVFSKLSTV